MQINSGNNSVHFEFELPCVAVYIFVVDCRAVLGLLTCQQTTQELATGRMNLGLKAIYAVGLEH